MPGGNGQHIYLQQKNVTLCVGNSGIQHVLSVLILFSCFCANTKSQGQAPSIQWQHTFGGTNFDQVESVIQTYDGGFAAAGISTSNNGNVTGNHGAGDFWIIKLNASGVLQWQKSYGGTADDGAFSISQTSDSGYIVAGTSTSVNGNVTANHGFIDFWIIRLNSSGVLLWQKSFGGSSVDIPYDIHQTTDLGFIIGGYTVSNDGDVSGNHGFEDFWIMKITSAGVLQWQKCFGGSMDERALSVQQTSDGGYVAGGYTKSTDGDVAGNHGDYDYWIVKMSSTGALQWQKCLGGTSSDQGSSVQQTSDGGYIAAGFTASVNGDVTFNHGFEDLWMVKMNSTGNLQWQKSLGGTGVDQAYKVKQLSGGGFVVAGSSYSLNGDVTGNHGGYDDWIARTDISGNIVWQKSLGGSSVEECYSISTTTGNGYILAGGTLSNDGNVSGNHGDCDYWIVKLNESAVALPVDLLSFDGVHDQNKNILQWSTAAEVNNNFFDLERSSDGEAFMTIARVSGQGNSSSVHQYEYADEEISSGSSYYYRLRQEDYDGSSTYSNVIEIKSSARNIFFQVSPNPCSGIANIEYAVNDRAHVIISVYNSMGQMVALIYDGLRENGIYRHQFSAKELGLPAGMYTACLQEDADILYVKLVEN